MPYVSCARVGRMTGATRRTARSECEHNIFACAVRRCQLRTTRKYRKPVQDRHWGETRRALPVYDGLGDKADRDDDDDVYVMFHTRACGVCYIRIKCIRVPNQSVRRVEREKNKSRLATNQSTALYRFSSYASEGYTDVTIKE